MNIFLTTPYLGSDGDEFKEEFVAYLKEILLEDRWNALSDYQLYLSGGRKAIEEIIEEIRCA